MGNPVIEDLESEEYIISGGESCEKLLNSDARSPGGGQSGEGKKGRIRSPPSTGTETSMRTGVFSRQN